MVLSINPHRFREQTVTTVCSLLISLGVAITLVSCGTTTGINRSSSGVEISADSLAVKAAQFMSVGNSQTATEYYAQALAQDPEHETSLRAMAEFKSHHGDVDLILPYLSALEASHLSRAEDYVTFANNLSQSGSQAASNAIIDRGLENFPATPILNALKGARLVKGGQPSEAIPFLTKAKNSKGRAGRIALSSLGEIYFLRKNYDDALPILEKFDRRFPDDFDVSMRIAYIYFARDDFDNAITHYRAAAEQQPKSIDARLGMAKTYQGQGRTRPAIRAYEKAIKISGYVPSMSPAILATANAYNKKGEYRRSIKMLEKSRRAFPFTAGLHCAYGMALAGEGDYDGAIKAFSEATGDRAYSDFAHSQVRRLEKLRASNR